jgi:hypothetical protein
MLHYNVFLQLVPFNLFNYFAFLLLFAISDPHKFLHRLLLLLLLFLNSFLNLRGTGQLFFYFILFEFLLIVEELLLEAGVGEYYGPLFPRMRERIKE